MATDRPRADVPEERIRCLKDVELFDGLGLDALSEVASRMIEEEHPAGHVLVSSGAPLHALYVVVSGAVELGEGTSSHRIGATGTFGEWEILGEVSVVQSAVCTLSSRVMLLRRESWEDLAFAKRDVLIEILSNFVRATARRRAAMRASVDAAPLFPGNPKL